MDRCRSKKWRKNISRAAIAAMLVCTSALADDFAARVAEGKRATETHDGTLYDTSLAPQLGAAMRACLPPGSNTPTNVGSFTLVGHVTADGVLNSVAVEPATEVSSCFAEHLKKTTLPKPPTITPGKDYPLVVEMRIGQ